MNGAFFVSTEFHSDTFFILPAVMFQQGECECCGEPGGFRIGLSLFVWSVSFGWTGGHDE